MLRRGALRHRAEAATTRAQVSEYHERGRSTMEAFMNIRAARRLTNSVETPFAQLAFQRLDRLKVSLPLT